MRFILLDPGAVTTVGHHFNLLQIISLELERRGIDAVSYAHVGSAENGAQLKTVPHFRASPYSMASRDPICGPLENFLIQSDVLFEDLCRLPETLTEDGQTVLLFPSIHWNQIYGIARWLGTLPPGRRPPVIMLLGQGAGITITGNQCAVNPEIGPYYRIGYNRLRAINYPHLTMATYGSRLVEEHRFLAQMDVHLQPLHFAGEDIVLPPRAPAANGRINLLYAGDARPNKGFHLLPQILAQVLTRTANVDATVQVSGYVSLLGLDPVANNMEAFTRQTDRVKLVTGYQDREAYLRMIHESDIVLLPYQADSYRSNISGIATEALFLGKPMVVPEGSFLADLVRQLGDCGTISERQEPEAIVAATLALLADFPTYAQRALKARDIWRSQHGTGHLIDFMLSRVR